jgi:hypothetical protein
MKNNKKLIIENIITINKILNELQMQTPDIEYMPGSSYQKNQKRPSRNKGEIIFNLSDTSDMAGDDIYGTLSQSLRPMKLVSKYMAPGIIAKIKTDFSDINKKLEQFIEDSKKQSDNQNFILERNLMGELAELVKLTSAVLIYVPWVNAGKLLMNLLKLTPIIANVYTSKKISKTDLKSITEYVNRIFTILSNSRINDREISVFNA